jgi:ribosomal protein L40E
VSEPEREATADSVCWLERVCEACGALDDGPPAPVCGRCGTPRESGPEVVPRP